MADEPVKDTRTEERQNRAWKDHIKEILQGLGPPFSNIGQIFLGPAGRTAFGAFLIVFVIPLMIPLLVSWWLLIPADWAWIKATREVYIATVRRGFGVINDRVDYFHSFEYDSILDRGKRIRLSLVRGQKAIVRIDSASIDFIDGLSCPLPPEPSGPILQLKLAGVATIIEVDLSKALQEEELHRGWWKENEKSVNKFFPDEYPKTLYIDITPTPSGQDYGWSLQACPNARIRITGAIEVYKEVYKDRRIF